MNDTSKSTEVKAPEIVEDVIYKFNSEQKNLPLKLAKALNLSDLVKELNQNSEFISFSQLNEIYHLHYKAGVKVIYKVVEMKGKLLSPLQYCQEIIDLSKKQNECRKIVESEKNSATMLTFMDNNNTFSEDILKRFENYAYFTACQAHLGQVQKLSPAYL